MLDLTLISAIGLAVFGLIAAPDESLIADGGGGSGDDPTGGGQPGTPTGGGQSNPNPAFPGPAIPFGENGGVNANTYLLFIPVQDIQTGRCYIGTYDVNSFDDPKDPSSYTYRAEDVIKNCIVTVNRVWLVVRDLGLATVTVHLNGVDFNGKLVSAQTTKKIGNKVATGALITYRVDLQLSCYRPQLTLSRAAGGGPLCVTEVTMAGEVDEGG